MKYTLMIAATGGRRTAKTVKRILATKSLMNRRSDE